MLTVDAAIAALSDDLETLAIQLDNLKTNSVGSNLTRPQKVGYSQVINAAEIKLNELVKTQTAYISFEE